MRFYILLFFTFLYLGASAQSNYKEDSEAILAVLESQRMAWSNGDIETFMEGYWKNDSLKFYGAGGITYGWKNTLSRYKEGYPTKDHTGKLEFKINALTQINSDAYYVMGEFFLKRHVGNANGIFMIIFKKINGVWKIIADTSC